MTTEQNTATVLLYADVDVKHWNANGGLDGADNQTCGWVRKGDYAPSYLRRLKETLLSTESAEAPCYKEDLCRIVFKMATFDPEGPFDFADETRFLPKVVQAGSSRLYHRSDDEPSFKDRMVRMVLGRDLGLSRVKGNEVFALIHKNSKDTLQSVRVFMRVPEAEAGCEVLAPFHRWEEEEARMRVIIPSWRNAKRGHELNLYRGISAEAHEAARKVAEMLAPFMAYASAKETISNQQRRISRQESQAVSVDRKWEEHNAKAAALFTRLTDRGMSEVEDAEALLAEVEEGRLQRLLGVDVENAKRNLALARSMLAETPEMVLCPTHAQTGVSWLFHTWDHPERWFMHIADVAKQYSEAMDIISRSEAGNPHYAARPADAERAEIAEAQAIIDSIDLDALLSPVLKASEEAREVTAERVDLKTFRDAVATFINDSPRGDLDALIEDSGLLHDEFTASDLILEPTDTAHDFSSARVELTAAGEAEVTVPVLLKSRYSVERTFGSGEVTMILPKVTATRSRNPDGRFTSSDAMFFAYGREWMMPEHRWSSSRPEGFKAEVTYDLQAVEEAQEVAA